MAAIQYGGLPIVSTPAFNPTPPVFVPIDPIATVIPQYAVPAVSSFVAVEASGTSEIIPIATFPAVGETSQGSLLCAEPVTVTAFSRVLDPTTVFITVTGILATTTVAAEAQATSVILSNDIDSLIATTEVPQVTETAVVVPPLTNVISSEIVDLPIAATDVPQTTLTAVLPYPAVTEIVPIDNTVIPAAITDVLQVTESAVDPPVATDVILSYGAETQVAIPTDLVPAYVPTTLLSVLVPVTADLTEVGVLPSTTLINVIPTLATDQAITVIPLEATTVASLIPGVPATDFGGSLRPSASPTTIVEDLVPAQSVESFEGETRPSATSVSEPSSKSAQCGKGQVVSCCNSRGGSSSGSIVGGLLENLVGGNCEQVPINVIGANGILMDQCGANQAACCTAGEDGLLDVPCIPLTL